VLRALAAEPRPLGPLCAELAARFGAPPAQVSADVHAFVASLRELHVVERREQAGAA
jgi:DNA-binding IclR family transcriptional regulator